jgi:hypothetical protein
MESTQIVRCPVLDCRSDDVRLQQEGPGSAAYWCNNCGVNFRGVFTPQGFIVDA